MPIESSKSVEQKGTNDFGRPGNSVGRPRAAPYLPYPTLKEFLVRLSNDGIPERVEPGDLAALSANSRNHLLASLKFLLLCDEHGQPTEALRQLVNAVMTEHWPAAAGLTIRQAYPPLFEIDLARATPKEFVDTFNRNYPGTDSVRRKSRTFFLHAARDAGIPLNPAIIRTTKPRGSRNLAWPTAGRRERPAARHPTQSAIAHRGAAASRQRHPASPPPGSRPDASGPGLAERLVAQIDTRQMQPAEQRAYWTVLKWLKARGL